MEGGERAVVSGIRFSSPGRVTKLAVNTDEGYDTSILDVTAVPRAEYARESIITFYPLNRLSSTSEWTH